MELCSCTGALIFVALCAFGCNKADQSATANPTPSATTPTSATPGPASSAGPVATTDEEAIKAAIGQHLRDISGINMAAMDMTVDSISIQGDKAEAKVTFRSKQGGTPMSMSYSLERHANDWLVLHSNPGGGQFAHPPMDRAHSGADTSQSSTTPNLRRFYKQGSSSSPADAPATTSAPEK